MVRIKLNSENVIDYLNYDTSQKRFEERIIYSNLKNKSIKVVDDVGTDISKNYCDKIRDLIIETYGSENVNVSLSKKADKESINIVVIHNKDFYVESEDVYSKKHAGIVQHVTMEDFLDSAKYAIKTVINESLIKKDLNEGIISLFPWKDFGFNGDISFGIRIADENKIDRYFFMKISSDGSFVFKEQELNLFEMTEYYDLVDIYETDNSINSIKGIIKDEYGNINIIRDTGLFTLPEIDMISDELKKGNNKLRGKESRDMLLSGVLDLKMFKKDGKLYYFSGIVGNGMRAKVENSSNIRILETYKDSEIIIDELLPLMDTSIIRNGQLTVLPFPFKYLREYVKTIC